MSAQGDATNNHLFRIVSFQTMSSSTQDLQWLFFDVFGTVVDWKSHMSATLFTISQRVDPESMKAHSRSTDEHWQDFAQEWRTGFMKGVKELMGKREDAGMDVRMHPLTWSPHGLHRKLLDQILEKRGIADRWTDSARDEAVHEWHNLPGWTDSAKGLARLQKKFVVCTLTNGDTAVMVHMAKTHSPPLVWDLHLCCDSMGTYKPDPKVYQTAIKLSRCRPEQVAMVASHGYDLDAAREQGMKTYYTKRPTEDLEDPIDADEARRRGFDGFFEADGLMALADELGC